MSSIRSKMLLGYLILAIGMGGFVSFASIDLYFLERRVNEGVMISAFQEMVQEMRRHEKNFFLYHAPLDYNEAQALAIQLIQQLDNKIFASIAQEEELLALRKALERYHELLNAKQLVETTVRATGHEILAYSERLADRERANLVAIMRQSRYEMFWSVTVLVLLALIGGKMLYLTVGRPLHQLEEQLEPLTQGRFRSFTMVSRDREIVSFTQALNRMLEELELRRRQLLQTEKLASLGILASGIAHELNNPLSNISSSNQILLEELDNIAELDSDTRQELRSWSEQIDAETERAKHIVRTLLDYSRKPTVVEQTTPLMDILQKSLLLLHQRLPSADTVSIDIANDLLLRADPSRMQQVFINLIQNALDAGGNKVHIYIHARFANEGDWPPPSAALVIGTPVTNIRAVFIIVSDDGPGVPAPIIGHLFDPFFTTHAPGEGTGLGLYIVSEIIQEQQGGIAIMSPPQGGVCFSIWLPC